MLYKSMYYYYSLLLMFVYVNESLYKVCTIHNRCGDTIKLDVVTQPKMENGDTKKTGFGLMYNTKCSVIVKHSYS